MDNSRLPPELQNMVDQFTKFRNEYLTLKTHHDAQDELIKLQKLELEKINSHVEHLASALIDYQRRFNSTIDHLKTENQRLRRVIEETRRECEDSRDRDNEIARDAHRHNDDYVDRLEDDLKELRTKIATQDEKHREQIKSIEQRHDNEITVYEEKLERKNWQEKRLRDEIEAYKKKLEHLDSMEIRCRMAITQREKNSVENSPFESTAKDKYSDFTHPALGHDTGNKRKRIANTSCRWPQLAISVKKEAEQKSTQKKKKLYLPNDETVVDLAS